MSASEPTRHGAKEAIGFSHASAAGGLSRTDDLPAARVRRRKVRRLTA